MAHRCPRTSCRIRGTGLMYHISLHVDVEVKLYQEVVQELGDEPVKFEHLAKLTYCTQVVKENLRLIPPLQSFTKCSPTDHDTSLGKYKVPAGSSHTRHGLGASLPSEALGGALYIQARAIRGRGGPPFSYGSRACIGQQLSLIEQRVACLDGAQVLHAPRLEVQSHYLPPTLREHPGCS